MSRRHAHQFFDCPGFKAGVIDVRIPACRLQASYEKPKSITTRNAVHVIRAIYFRNVKHNKVGLIVLRPSYPVELIDIRTLMEAATSR